MEQEIHKRIRTLRLARWLANDIRFYFNESRDASYRIAKETLGHRDEILKRYGTDFDRELAENYRELELLRSSFDKEITCMDEWVESLCRATTINQCIQATEDERERAILIAYRDKLVHQQRRYYGIEK